MARARAWLRAVPPALLLLLLCFVALATRATPGAALSTRSLDLSGTDAEDGMSGETSP